MDNSEEIRAALHKLGALFPTDGINIEVNYYFNCRENRRTFTVYVPSAGAVVGRNRLEDAVREIIKKGGKE